jgi:hypothetical protein
MKTTLKFLVCILVFGLCANTYNPIPPKPKYIFSSSITMKMTSSGNKKNDNFTMRYKYMFTNALDAMGMKFLDSNNPDMAKLSQMMELIVLDFEELKMYNFINSEGNKTVLGIGFKGDRLQKTVEKENAKIKITANGQTKTIAGYQCDGYNLEHEGNKDQVIMWISQKSIGLMAKMAEKMAQGAGSMAKSKNYLGYGAHPELKKMAETGRMSLGYSSVSKNGDKMEMEFEKLNANDKSEFDATAFKSLF